MRAESRWTRIFSSILVALLLIPAAPVTAATAAETIWLDTYEPHPDGGGGDGAAGPVFSTTVLQTGVPYAVTVEGVFSIWYEAAWREQGTCGNPEPPTWPSPDMVNYPAGVDAQWGFAGPVQFMCGDGKPLPKIWPMFEVSLDGGLTWFHPFSPSAQNGPRPDHKYIFRFTGQGARLGVRLNDWYTRDNYGVLKVTLSEWAFSVDVTTNSGSVLKPGNKLAFAGSNNDQEWGNTTPDRIEARATVTGVSNPTVKWNVTELSSGKAKPAEGTGMNFSFQIVDLPQLNPFIGRPPISFRITAKLTDSNGNELAKDEKAVSQSALGARRQEYVDHPTIPPHGTPFQKVPPATAFNEKLEIISPWAVQAISRLLAAAVESKINTQWTSVYRSPLYSWQLYLDLRNQHKIEVPFAPNGSQHYWGAAVDFAVQPRKGQSQKDAYCELATMSRDLGYVVVSEGRTDHVHIQQYQVGQGEKLPCRR